MSKAERVPQYDYASTGLEIEAEKVGHPDSHRTVVVQDIPRVDPDHESWKRVQAALKLPRQEGGIGFISIPPVEDSGTVETYHFPWGGNTANSVGVNEMAAYAAARPDRTILAIDSPATGNSKKLKASVAHKIAKTGSYLQYGEVFAEAFGTVLQDFQELVFSGSSQGGRRAIATTAVVGDLLGFMSAELNVQDPIGTRQQSLLELMKAFIIKEGGHSAKHIAASPDRIAAEAQRANDSRLHMARVFGKTALRGGAYNQLISEPRAMATGGLRGDLFAALKFTKAVSVSSAELNELADVEDTQKILEELAVNFPGTPIEHRIIKSQTHAMNAGNPGVLGVLL